MRQVDAHRLGALSLLLLLLALAACTVGPDFVRPSAQTPDKWPDDALGSRPDAHARASATTADSADLRRWWTDFNDPTLNSLIERAAASNLDLRAAVLRIDEARAQRGVAGAALWPTVSANASLTRTRLSESTPTGALFDTFGNVRIPGVSGINIPNPYNQYQLGADVSWELDLFGRVRRSIEAADAEIDESLEDQHATLVALLGDVARSYMELRGAQASRATAEQSIATTGDLLELTRQRRAAGLTSEVDVVQAAAQLSATQAELPTYDLAMAQSINQLSRLLGQPADALRAELGSAQALPTPPPTLPIGLPAALARRRPDIRKAEANLHAATAQIGVAVASVYPRITLTGSGGVQSETAGELTEWASRFFAIGPTLELPVFDRGTWATIPLQKVRAQEAAVAYANTVLNALQEADNARAAVDADQDRSAWLERTVEQNRDAVELARQRYANGVASFIEILDAERTLQQNQLSLAQSRTVVGDDLVALYRALGGGWEQSVQ